PFLDSRVLYDREVDVVGRLNSQVRESQRERTDVAGKLKRAVAIEPERVGRERRARTSRRVVGVLARIVERNPHRLPVAGYDGVVGRSQRNEPRIVEPLPERLLV